MNTFLKYFLFLLVLICSNVVAQETNTPAPAPVKQESPFSVTELQNQATNGEDHFFRDLMNMFASLGLIIIVIFIASWFMKRILNTRLQQMNATSEIKILERRSLTPKTAIYLVEIGGKGMALAESTNGITLLTQFSPDKDFSQILEEKIKKDGISRDQ
jgi:flagellar biosynthetic protein FliO